DNFFELGGDSIKGAVLIHRLQRRLGQPLSVAALFDAPTVARFAASLETSHPAAAARIAELSPETVPDHLTPFVRSSPEAGPPPRPGASRSAALGRSRSAAPVRPGARSGRAQPPPTPERSRGRRPLRAAPRRLRRLVPGPLGARGRCPLSERARRYIARAAGA